MKYQKGQQVILLEVNGLPAYSSEIRGYEPTTQLYRIAFKIPNNEVEWIEDVPENRLMLLTDTVPGLRKH